MNELKYICIACILLSTDHELMTRCRSALEHVKCVLLVELLSLKNVEVCALCA